MNVYELNLDGLVGPTHHFAGLPEGNVASKKNALKPSNPQAAALQGLKKMRLMHSLGLKQGLLPPQQRPNLNLLHQLGFRGTPAQQVNQAYKKAPGLLSACSTASCMWTANTATITPSSDSADQKVHFTAANLVTNLHRQQEAAFSKKILENIFANPDFFQHHSILPNSSTTSDEGGANHSRFCQSHAHPGVHLFVYGKSALTSKTDSSFPIQYPARQTKEASESIARNHLLSPNQLVFAQQNPQAIDRGVFHNDLISVGNEFVFLVHEQAFVQQKEILAELRSKVRFDLKWIEITKEQLSLEEAVACYLFNSQIVTLPGQQEMMLIAPVESQRHPAAKACIDQILADSRNPIRKVDYLDLKESMRNGGGPACLRLRVPLKEQELKAMHSGVLVHETLLDELELWIKKYYRNHLEVRDLADPELIQENLAALDQLTELLKLGPTYPFQLNETVRTR